VSEPHKGWFRVEEAAVRKLRDTYDKQSAYRLALAVYVTMCRVSNLEGSDTFTRRIASMADDAGLSYNATAEGLELVKSAGLVTITAKTVVGSKERAPSEYQLMRMSPTECGTSPTEKGRLPKSRNSRVLPRVSKNLPRTNPRTSTKREQLRAAPSLSDLLSFLQSLPSPDPKYDADYYHLHWRENGFTNRGKPIRNYQLALKKWFKAEWLPSQKRRLNVTGSTKPQERNYAPVEDSWTTK